MNLFIYYLIRISKSIETESILMLPRAGEGVDWQMTVNVYWVSFLGDKSNLKLCCGDSCTM